MPFLITTVALPLIVWGSIYVLRTSIFLTIALFLVFTCVFPAEFFAVDLGGLTWTLDRVCLLCVAAQFVLLWRQGELQFQRWQSLDIALVLFVMWLIARTINQPLGSVLPKQPPTLMHLANGYLIPVFLYAVLRTTRLDVSKLRVPLWLMLTLGGYLGLTALLEIAKLWGLVFPRFIADPTLGIHFGRARGPMLQSVRLGIVLLVCLVALMIYTVWLHPWKRFNWLIVGVLGSLMSLGVLVTYTRSVWMGLAWVTLCLILLGLEGLPRRSALVGLLFAGLAIGIIKGPDVVAFKREYSAAETRESTYMRAAFAYVSLQMFQDKPLAGFGFNQFQVYNLPYLADRSTEIRVESIRGYVHHNSFLSLLVDLGLIGFGLYMFVGLAAVIQIYLLWQASEIPRWVRGFALLALCAGGVHLIQMAFHEVSFSTIENSFMFCTLGLVMAGREQFQQRRRSEYSTSTADTDVMPESPRPPAPAPLPSNENPTPESGS